MEITKKTFCTNIRNISDGLRTSYICEKTGRVCPKLDYSSGKPLPSKLFIKNGCPLIKEENEQIIEEIKEAIIAPVVETTEVKEEIAESIVATVEKEKKVTQQNKPKTNNYKKKKSNNKK